MLGPLPVCLRLRLSRPVSWVGFAWVLLVWMTAQAGELSDKQRSQLISISRERMTSRWIDLTTNQLAELRQKADDYLADCRKHHLPGGLVASVRFRDTNRTEVVSYEALDQSAAWTGCYLAGLTYRYVVTRETRNLSELRQALDAVTTLLKASDRPGYVAAFAGKADDAAYRAYYSKYGGEDSARPGFGRWAYPSPTSSRSLVWLGNSSRDNYALLNLGLGTTYQLVRDVQVRSRIATNVNLILDRLIADQWRIDDGHGNKTFVTPLLSLALLRVGASVNPTVYRQQYDARVKELRELEDVQIRGVSRYNEYASGVGQFANALTLVQLETNQTRRLTYQSRFTELWREASPHLNAWFAASYVCGFNSVLDPIVRATLQGQLYAYPSPPRWSVRGDFTGRAEFPTIEANGTTWSRYALPVYLQGAAPFQWAASPYLLASGTDEPVSHPGIDLFLPFWMGREGGVIPAEDEPPPIQAQFKSPATARTATNATSRTVRPTRLRGDTNAPVIPTPEPSKPADGAPATNPPAAPPK